MGGIVDGISSLFGGGSANRGQQRDTNNSGSSLDNAGNAISSAQNDFNQQDGNSLGWASDGYQQGYNSAGQQTGTINGQGAAIGGMNGIAGQQGTAFNNAYPGAFNTMLGADGMNPNGSAIAGFDPYQMTGNSLIGKYSDSVAPGYDNAVTAANHDLMQRGMTGANSVAPSEIADIRRTQASDVAGYGRNVGLQAENEKYNRMGNALGMITGAGNMASNGYGNVAQGYDSQGNAINRQGNAYDNNAGGWQSLANSYGAAGNSKLNMAGAWGNNAAGWANGAQNYQNQANNQVNNLKGLAGLFG